MNKISIVKIMGGLGNQLFQYALARSNTLYNGNDLYLDTTWYDNQKEREFQLEQLNINAKIADFDLIKNFMTKKNRFLSLLNKNHYKTVYEENIFSYDEDILYSKGNIYLSGYWQNEKYFLEKRGTILNDFQLKIELDDYNKKILKEINNSKSISVHIRRGDIAKDPRLKERIGTIDLEYYRFAIKKISKDQDNLKFFIFSDDIDWAKNNLNFDYEHTFLKNNTAVIDLFLMSRCKFNITANSSFSWWGAWLNNNSDKKIISPKFWYKDIQLQNKAHELLPKSWIKI
tara:strand:- start:2061 stop:2921 length:861 start_codon:yes stop_codon:yes gene_type:complete